MSVFAKTRWMVCGGLLLGGSVFAQGEAPYEVVTEDVEVAGTATRPERPDLSFKAVPYDLQTLMFTFPSGFRLMFQQDNTLPIVAITTAFDVGAADDPEGQEGLAHLLEHSWFLSQQADYPKIWALQVDDMGCNLNAFTNYDNTVYMSVCPARELNRL
ncbi:MAG: insulinase family protein, partial [Myxococcota bacterium]|nr:insulinase family protein [Myxococcota bacterium]